MNSIESTPASSILIVEPDEIRSDRYARKIRKQTNYLLAGITRGKRQTAALLRRKSVDFALVSTTLADGSAADVVALIVKRNPNALVLVAADTADENTVMQVISAGANGYMLISEMTEDLGECFKLMVAGGSPASPTIARCVLRSLHTRSEKRRLMPADCPLSPRELDVMRLAAQGIGFAQIAHLLTISEHTVTTHVKKIYRKLEVHSRDEAVFECRKRGFVD